MTRILHRDAVKGLQPVLLPAWLDRITRRSSDVRAVCEWLAEAQLRWWFRNRAVAGSDDVNEEDTFMEDGDSDDDDQQEATAGSP